MVAASVYLCVPFCPTRHNPADDPTRDKEVRDPIEGLGLEGWEDAELYDLIALPKTRRWASNWVRLVLHVCGAKATYFGRRDLYRQTHRKETLYKEDVFKENVSHKFWNLMPLWDIQVKGGFCLFGSSLAVLDFAAYGFRSPVPCVPL